MDEEGVLKKREAGWLLLFLLLCAITVFFNRPERFLVVSVPVADIRRIPQDAKPGYGHDDLNETQVLYNEILRYRGENAGWYRVEALEQKEFTHHKLWQGYPGWIRKEKAVFIKARPARINAVKGEEERRQDIVREAKLFLGIPYLWGGRSITTGVDCSGLVNLAYRASGVDIARDAHEQWMTSRPLRADELKPADLIFLSRKDNFTSIVHVMLFLGGEDFIEGPGTGQKVRTCNFKEKFGLSLSELKERNYIAAGQKIYFGRILP